MLIIHKTKKDIILKESIELLKSDNKLLSYQKEHVKSLIASLLNNKELNILKFGQTFIIDEKC